MRIGSCKHFACTTFADRHQLGCTFSQAQEEEGVSKVHFITVLMHACRHSSCWCPLPASATGTLTAHRYRNTSTGHGIAIIRQTLHTSAPDECHKHIISRHTCARNSQCCRRVDKHDKRTDGSVISANHFAAAEMQKPAVPSQT